MGVVGGWRNRNQLGASGQVVLMATTMSSMPSWQHCGPASVRWSPIDGSGDDTIVVRGFGVDVRSLASDSTLLGVGLGADLGPIVQLTVEARRTRSRESSKDADSRW